MRCVGCVYGVRAVSVWGVCVEGESGRNALLTEKIDKRFQNRENEEKSGGERKN